MSFLVVWHLEERDAGDGGPVGENEDDREACGPGGENGEGAKADVEDNLELISTHQLCLSVSKSLLLLSFFFCFLISMLFPSQRRTLLCCRLNFGKTLY